MMTQYKNLKNIGGGSQYNALSIKKVKKLVTLSL
jgi:hypothetical protein